jgi:hypothetical protein
VVTSGTIFHEHRPLLTLNWSLLCFFLSTQCSSLSCSACFLLWRIVTKQTVITTGCLINKTSFALHKISTNPTNIFEVMNVCVTLWIRAIFGHLMIILDGYFPPLYMRHTLIINNFSFCKLRRRVGAGYKVDLKVADLSSLPVVFPLLSWICCKKIINKENFKKSWGPSWCKFLLLSTCPLRSK